jgi:hypothetical protein
LPGSLILAERDGRRSVDSGEYRARARELREITETTHDLVTRAHLLVIAGRYDQLAEWAEAREREAEKP